MESSGLILTSDLKSQGATIEAISRFAVEHAIEILSNAQIVAQELATGKKTIDELRSSLTETLAKDNELTAKELQIAGLVQKVIFGSINQAMVDLGNTCAENKEAAECTALTADQLMIAQAEVMKSEVLSALISEDTMETNYSITLSNLSLLNRFLIMMYPELNRF